MELPLSDLQKDRWKHHTEPALPPPLPANSERLLDIRQCRAEQGQHGHLHGLLHSGMSKPCLLRVGTGDRVELQSFQKVRKGRLSRHPHLLTPGSWSSAGPSHFPFLRELRAPIAQLARAFNLPGCCLQGVGRTGVTLPADSSQAPHSGEPCSCIRKKPQGLLQAHVLCCTHTVGTEKVE